jgi:UrcA family protein
MKRFSDSIRLSSLPCAALLCLATNAAAQAGPPTAEKLLVGTVRVAYSDLDLSQRADVQILLGRIEKAAFRACGGNPRRHPSYNVMPGHTEAVFKDCRDDAITRAVLAVDVPVLAQARVQADDR